MVDSDREPSFLVVEDEPVTAEIVLAVLAPLGEVRLAESAAAALALAQERMPDILLLDIVLPDMDGHDLLRRITALPGAADCAALFVTARSAAEEQIRGFDAGAVDYIVKPIVPEALRARIAHHLQRQAEARRVRRLADYDDLTGVLNRRRFFELLAAEVERAQRYRRPLVLAIFDIDHFKQVNDGFGHDAGDALLHRVGACCLNRLRQPDCVGRIGGEEFAVLLPEAGLERALRVAEMLRRDIAGLRVAIEAAPTAGAIAVTASFGLAALQPEEDPAALRRRADQALYRAKAAGRDRVMAG